MGFVPDLDEEARIEKRRRDLLIAGVGSPFRVIIEDFTTFSETEIGIFDKFEEAEKIADQACKKRRRKRHSTIVRILNHHNHLVGLGH